MFRILIVYFSFISVASANVIGSDAQNFAPQPDGLDFITVHSSKTLNFGIMNFGFFVNYAQNTFPAYEGIGEPPEQSLLNKNDSFTSADINFAVGLTDRFQAGLSLPYIITQDIEDSANLGKFEGSGTSEVRPSLKYHLGSYGKWGFATAASMNFNRIENNPYVGTDGGPITNLEFVADRSIGKWNVALNVGHRWRSPGEPIPNSGIDPLPNQFIYSAAASHLIPHWDTKVIFEIYGSTPVEDTRNLSNRQNSSLEALLGAKHDFTHNIAFHAGAGTELMQGTSTPDWRAYTGINYAFGPVLKKSDEPRVMQAEIEHEKRRMIRLWMPDLQFIFGTAQLTAESEKIVDAVVNKIVTSLRNIEDVLVEGHTDSIGSLAYNQDLSERRAATVSRLLVEKGAVKKDRIRSVGYGETKPIADNGNYQGRQENRRVEIKIGIVD